MLHSTSWWCRWSTRQTREQVNYYWRRWTLCAFSFSLVFGVPWAADIRPTTWLSVCDISFPVIYTFLRVRQGGTKEGSSLQPEGVPEGFPSLEPTSSSCRTRNRAVRYATMSLRLFWFLLMAVLGIPIAYPRMVFLETALGQSEHAYSACSYFLIGFLIRVKVQPTRRTGKKRQSGFDKLCQQIQCWSRIARWSCKWSFDKLFFSDCSDGS